VATTIDRTSPLAASPSLQHADLARARRAAGHDVIDLALGDPGFPTPAHIVEAALQAARAGHTRYTDSRGIPELRRAVVRSIGRDTGRAYDADTEVLIAPGARAALLYALQTLVGREDEVVVPEPCWSSYAPLVQMCGGRFVGVAARAEDGFRPSIDAIVGAITDRTRVLLLNNPVNPTGVVWRRDELAALVDAVRERDVWIVSDELYDKFVLSDVDTASLAHFPVVRDRTVLINGLSKTYAMTGWRVGYAAAPAALTARLLRLHQHTASCAGSVSQYAALAALDGPQECVTRMVAAFRARRDAMLGHVAATRSLGCLAPEGTFYALLDVRSWGMASTDVARACLDQAGVAVTPGSGFGRCTEGFVRVSLSVSDEHLREAVQRIDEVGARPR
jgi:aspartate aminotransferase